MTSFSQHAVPRSHRGKRLWSVAAVACGAMMLPAASAVADDMTAMTNGTLCPHASGEGPDALAALPPGAPAAPERAPSDAPLAPAVKSSPAKPAPANRPATPKPPSQVTQPTTQVTKPATQVQTQRPTTTAAQSVPVTAVVNTSARAVANMPSRSTSGTPKRVHRPHAKRAVHHARTIHRTTHVRRPSLEPAAAGSPIVAGPTVAESHPAAATSGRSSVISLAAGLGLLVLLGIGAGAIARRRRGMGGVAATEQPHGPAWPSYTDAQVEAELHEMISEANARVLLARDEAEDMGDPHESLGSR